MVELAGSRKDISMYPIASEETYKDGQIIFEEGSSGDWVYVILSGSVEISKTIGGREFIITALERGEIFGELGYLGAVKRIAAARAIGKTTLGVIDRTFMDQEFNKLSGYFRNILVALVKRFRDQIDRASDFTSRREPRVQKTLSLTFKDRQSFVSAYTGNVSKGGLFISTQHLLKEGERFLLELQLPGLRDPIRVKCEVAWTREQSDIEKRASGMGVRFCDMTRKDTQLLDRYLQL